LNTGFAVSGYFGDEWCILPDTYMCPNLHGGFFYGYAIPGDVFPIVSLIL